MIEKNLLDPSSALTIFTIVRMCHAKSPMALFSMFMYIMHGTFAIP